MERGLQLLEAIGLLLWLASRKTPFGPTDLVECFSVSKRTAYRWLRVLEEHALIRVDDASARPRPITVDALFRSNVLAVKTTQGTF